MQMCAVFILSKLQLNVFIFFTYLRKNKHISVFCGCVYPDLLWGNLGESACMRVYFLV